MASDITARASAIVFARSTFGRSSTWTACQLRPLSLGSKCRSRTVFHITSNDSTFFETSSGVSAKAFSVGLCFVAESPVACLGGGSCAPAKQDALKASRAHAMVVVAHQQRRERRMTVMARAQVSCRWKECTVRRVAGDARSRRSSQSTRSTRGLNRPQTTVEHGSRASLRRREACQRTTGNSGGARPELCVPLERMP